MNDVRDKWFAKASEALLHFSQALGDEMDRAPLRHDHVAGTNYCPACRWEARASAAEAMAKLQEVVG
jgi:hypothetical protein